MCWHKQTKLGLDDAVTSFHATKCCHLVNESEASARLILNSASD